jgi:hypothetical protein
MVRGESGSRHSGMKPPWRHSRLRLNARTCFAGLRIGEPIRRIRVRIRT